MTDIPKNILSVGDKTAWQIWLREHDTIEKCMQDDVYFAYKGKMTETMKHQFKLHLLAAGDKKGRLLFYKFCNQKTRSIWLAAKHSEMDHIKALHPDISRLVDIPVKMSSDLVLKMTAFLDSLGVSREIFRKWLGPKYGAMVEKIPLSDDERKLATEHLEKGALQAMKLTRVVALFRLNWGIWRLVTERQKKGKDDLIKVVTGFSRVVRDLQNELEGDTSKDTQPLPATSEQLNREHEAFLEKFKGKSEDISSSSDEDI